VPKNVAFGVVPSAPFEAGRIALAPGETLVLYTDGVTDARSAAGEIYGSARLEAVLRGVGAAPPAAVLEAMQRSVEAFAAGAAQEDDITILVLRRR
jgi:sigma-B regulation protein RsbU (phosphoserine phosphatase)